MDFYFLEEGDIRVSPTGDIDTTLTPWRSDVQQAYIRAMTDEGDYLLYETLGASLSQLYGMPQSESTGSLGIDLINAALTRDQAFTGRAINVKAVPTGHQSIRFDIFIVSGSREQIKLSIEQKLGAEV